VREHAFRHGVQVLLWHAFRDTSDSWPLGVLCFGMRFAIHEVRLGNSSPQTMRSPEQEVRETLHEQLDVYNANSKHGQRLLRCVKDLARLVAEQENVAYDERFWHGFHRWVGANPRKASRYASAFVAGFLKGPKGAQLSAGHTLHLYLGIWRRWGVCVSESVREDVCTFHKEVWKPRQVSRQSDARIDRAAQFEKVEPVWDERMVGYLMRADASAFREQLRAITHNRSAHDIASACFHDMDALINKSDAGLGAVMVCTLAYSSLLRATGMRSLTGLEVKLSDFTELQELQDGEQLLTRVEHKVGSVRNASKLVYAKVVPPRTRSGVPSSIWPGCSRGRAPRSHWGLRRASRARSARTIANPSSCALPLCCTPSRSRAACPTG